MKRTKGQKTPDAILTGDFHLREDTPICRIDDFPSAQFDKLGKTKSLQQKYQCSVLNSGDMFHHWKASPGLISFAINCLPEGIITVYGNHDLPQHSLEMKQKSGLYTLQTAGTLTILDPNSYIIRKGFTTTGVNWEQNFKAMIHHDVLVWHVMTYPGDTPPWPGCQDLSAKQILEKYPQFPLIVTGHNHQPFVEELDGRLLVNPGSITRQKASETHDPVVYLWYSESNTVEPVRLTDVPAESVISREHIEKAEQKENRFEALIEKLNNSETNYEISFKANLERYFSQNKVPKLVRQLIWEIYEEE